MSLWKDSNNEIHDDSDGAALSLPIWPQGMVQITQAEADALLAPPPLSAKQSALNQIAVLESSITQRRLREAAIGQDGGWLSNVDSQIAALRLLCK